jgi:hypothetical protein
MASIAQTVGSFDKVLASCNALGARYQPKAPALTNTALSQLLERAQQSIEAVTVTRTAYRLAVNNRSASFAGIPKLAVRIVRMIASSESSSEHIADVMAIKNKFYPPKKSQKSAPVVKAEGGSKVATRSSGRMNYEAQIETFSNLVQIVQGLESYDPNEADLTIDALKATLTDLRAKSQAVAKAKIDYSNARINRDLVIYGQQGVEVITAAVKNYFRAAFGGLSRESGQVIALSK